MGKRERLEVAAMELSDSRIRELEAEFDVNLFSPGLFSPGMIQSSSDDDLPHLGSAFELGPDLEPLLFQRVLQAGGAMALARCACVCRAWSASTATNVLWHGLCKREFAQASVHRKNGEPGLNWRRLHGWLASAKYNLELCNEDLMRVQQRFLSVPRAQRKGMRLLMQEAEQSVKHALEEYQRRLEAEDVLPDSGHFLDSLCSELDSWDSATSATLAAEALERVTRLLIPQVATNPAIPAEPMVFPGPRDRGSPVEHCILGDNNSRLAALDKATTSWLAATDSIASTRCWAAVEEVLFEAA